MGQWEGAPMLTESPAAVAVEVCGSFGWFFGQFLWPDPGW